MKLDNKIHDIDIEVAQLCPTLCDPMDCSLSGSSIHGIFQARVLEWVAISFPRRSSQPRDQIQSPSLLADTLPSESPGKSIGQIGPLISSDRHLLSNDSMADTILDTENSDDGNSETDDKEFIQVQREKQKPSVVFSTPCVSCNARRMCTVLCELWASN